MSTADDRWLSLLTEQLPAEERADLLSLGAADLQEFLESRPEAVEDVLEILARRLDGEIDSQTWVLVDTALSSYLGRDLAYLMAWALQPDEQMERLHELEQVASPEVMAFLGTILGFYGPELERAFLCWNEIPDDWRVLYRDVYYDQLNQRPHIRLRIHKYNGEIVTIEGHGDSILALASSLVLTLRLAAIPDAFSQGRLLQFGEEVRQLFHLLFPALDEEIERFFDTLLPEAEGKIA